MIARGKRRIAGLILVVFTIWPLVHYQLVQRYQIDPWKFGGWAMYTVVNFVPQIDVYAIRDDGREELGLGSHAYPRAREAREALVKETYFWGALADPGPLARAAAAEAGGDPTIEVVITRFFLDPNSSRVSADRRSEFYPPAR